MSSIEDDAEQDIELLRNEPLFDSAYYLANNPDVEASGGGALQHFCRHGWRELRRPAPRIDMWWYWVRYLDPAVDAINPLVHFVKYGRALGYTLELDAYDPAPGYQHRQRRPVKRACLLAGYDRDGLIDDYVIDLARDLSRFAVVFYMADCQLRPGEIDKLAPYCRQTHAERHGCYDFGSWSKLIKEHIGWQELAEYDEVLFVNDSFYLLKSLESVFKKMDAKSCDWWGLQATKGVAATEHVASNQFSQPIPMERVKKYAIDSYEDDYTYDFLVASYFLAFRRPVIEDSGFQKLINSVSAQPDKLDLIKKYEVGLTHYLIGRQFDFETYVDYLFPFHPIFTAYAFTLIEQGFPLLKRYFLTHNHYDVANLSDWKDRVRTHLPQAPTAMIERNLLRVAPHESLWRSFSVTTDAQQNVVVPEPLTYDDIEAADQTTPKFDHWWCFTVCVYDHNFADNGRAVFEEVRDDASIKKIILTRSRTVDLSGHNVVVVPINSPEGQYYLLRSKQIFVKHAPQINVQYPIAPELHNFINLWHGIPLKKFGYVAFDSASRLDTIEDYNRSCRAVVASSAIDALAMAAAFHPLTCVNIWRTGLPRNDFVLCTDAALPLDLRDEQERLADELNGRALILFLPTFKQGQEADYYGFSPEQVDTLQHLLQQHNAVLGIREHMADDAHSYMQAFSSTDTLDLSNWRYANVEVLYRLATLLISDYSSCLVDFMLTGRPLISFTYDYQKYAEQDRGLFYNLEHVIPGPVCSDFEQLIQAIDDLLGQSKDRPTTTKQYKAKRNLFFSHLDDNNALRVVNQIKRQYVPNDGHSESLKVLERGGGIR